MEAALDLQEAVRENTAESSGDGVGALSSRWVSELCAFLWLATILT